MQVFAALRRVVRLGGPAIVTFSNRCFPSKAVALWQALDERGHRALVSAYFEAAGFTVVEVDGVAPVRGDPLSWVVGRTPGRA